MYVRSTLNLSNEFSNHELSIYPNPASEYIYVGGNSQADVMDYMILNTLGKRIQNGQLDQKHSISIYNLTPGIYILKLTNSDGKVYTKEIIKQ